MLVETSPISVIAIYYRTCSALKDGRKDVVPSLAAPVTQMCLRRPEPRINQLPPPFAETDQILRTHGE
jgi:hypothetical protein